MFFSTKQIDVKFYLDKINHNLESNNFFNFEENKKYAEKIIDFLTEYLNKYSHEIHLIKRNRLRKALEYLKNFRHCCKRKKKDSCQIIFEEIKKEFHEYTIAGSVYLVRHADKSKEENRNLSFMGVKQMKHFAEQIKEEIMIAPKPVEIQIYYSEKRRTLIFSNIITHINKAEKLCDKEITIVEKKDSRLLFGNFSDEEFADLELDMEKYGPDEGTFIHFEKWIGGRGIFSSQMKNKHAPDAFVIKNKIENFVTFGRKETLRTDKYVIVIGVSHAFILDSFLYYHALRNQIISTAEYAKIEINSLFYNGGWYGL
ncbi:MAG: hypothetical protein ABIC91_07850 [Nanoarchaeota archaeon]|nr:hypothetical protein [Nanoarchaeota archaeon]MBU1030618.1 hypothetical protein [Nanoarchaeota archaeon]MBU1850573.1 hypothetical protein [Nanoarchaeota archaeon]